MPVVEVYMWAGKQERSAWRRREQKKGIISGITDVFAEQGVPPEAVTVILHDIEKGDWDTAGRPADEA